MRKSISALAIPVFLVIASLALAASPEKGPWDGTQTVSFKVAGKDADKIKDLAASGFLVSCGEEGFGGFTQNHPIKVKHRRWKFVQDDYGPSMGAFKLTVKGNFTSKSTLDGTIQVVADDESCESEVLPFTASPD